MNLAIDVGNTETVLGLIHPGATEVTDTWRLSTGIPRTADEFRLLIRQLISEAGHDPDGLGRAVIGSVVPPLTETLVEALRSWITSVFTVQAADKLPIRLDVDEPMTVGADRIVNTLAASVLYGRDTIAVDLGTATTFDCITASGDFIGGVIAPGIMVGLDWLGQKTAKLPRVELAPPAQVIGRRTEACMQSGVFHTAIDGVDGLVRRIRAEWGKPDAFVVGTGGYASVVGPHSATIEMVEPYLTLIGLELAGAHLADVGGRESSGASSA